MTDIYQDSLATCTRYSNPLSDDYRVYQKSATRVTPADVDRYLASETAKEKEMIERMMVNMVGKGGRLLQLGELAKNLLFHVILPPFLFVVKAPKWFAQNVLPQLQNVNKNVTATVQELINRFAENIKSVDQHLGKFFKSATNSASDAVSKMAAKMKLGEAYSALQGMLAHLTNLQSSAAKQMGKSLLGFENKVRDKMSDAIQYLAGLIQGPLENMKQSTLKAMDNFGNALEASTKQITDPVKRFIENIKNGAEAIKNKVSEVTQPPINMILENYKHLSHLVDKHSKEVAEAISKVEKKVKKKSEELSAYVSDGMHKVTEVVNIGIAQVMQILPDPIINLYANIAPFGGQMLERTKNRWFSMVERTKAMVRKIKKSFDDIKRWFYEQAMRVKRAVMWLFDKMVEIIAKIYHHLLAILMKIFAVLKKVFKWVVFHLSIGRLMLRYTYLMIKESLR